MTSTGMRRLVVGSLAILLGLALVLPAQAADDEGPDFYQGIADASTLQLVVGLPDAIVQPLRDALLDDVLGQLGISLENNDLVIDLSLSNVDLERLAELDALGLAEATPLGGSLEGLVETLTDGALTCLDVPIDVAIPPGDTPLLAFTLLPTECDDDASDGVISSSSKVAGLTFDLKGLLAVLPAELSEPLDDALEIVENDVLTPAIDGLNGALGTIGDEVLEPITGGEVELGDIIKTPDFVNESLPLLEIGLIESTSTSTFDGGSVTSRATTTVAGVQFLDMICMLTDHPDEGTTFVANASATGEATEYSTVIPNITLGVCGDGDELARTILKLNEVDGVLGDILVNLGGGDLSLMDNLENSPSPISLSDILDELDGLLGELGVGTVLGGSEDLRTQSAEFVDVAVRPASVTFLPLNGALADTPLDGLRLDLFIGANQASAFAQVVPAEEPPPAPEVLSANLPRTGGGIAALLVGALAIGSAALLRRR